MASRVISWLFLLLFAPLIVEAAPLVYSGESTLWQNTVWEGEVLIDGILTVAPEATLEIRPGTIIRFTFFDSNGDGIGEHEIFIQGRVRALGHSDAPILFTAAGENPAPGFWGAINLMASEEASELAFCTIEYAYRGFHGHFAKAQLNDDEFRYNLRGTQFQESEISFVRCRFIDNFNGLQFRDSEVRFDDLLVRGSYWGVRGVHSRISLRRGLVEKNVVNGINLRDCDAIIDAVAITGNRKGLYLQESRAELRDSLLAGNSEHGIYLEESDVNLYGNRLLNNGRAAIKWVASRGKLRNNRFDGGSEFALFNDSDSPVDARENWWGSSDIAAIALIIRDHSDKIELGAVDSGNLLQSAPAFAQPVIYNP